MMQKCANLCRKTMFKVDKSCYYVSSSYEIYLKSLSWVLKLVLASLKGPLKFAVKNRFMENFIIFNSSTLGDCFW